MKKYGLMFFSLLVLLGSGCGKDSSGEDPDDATNGVSTGTNLTGDLPAATVPDDPTSESYIEGAEATDATDEDRVENSSFPAASAVSIALNGSDVTVVNPNGSSVSVTHTGAHVEINSSVGEIEYILSGSTSDGSLKIYSSKKFKLTLNGVTMTNPSGAAINIQSKKRNFIVLADGTTNTLCDGSSYVAVAGEDMKATLFSEGQSIISGKGTLNLSGLYKHALCNDQYLRIRQGVRLNVVSAVKDGVHVNDYLQMDGGTLDITASGDGLEVEAGYVVMNGGSLTVHSADDGVVTSYDPTASDADPTISSSITLNDGEINVTTTDTKGSALKASGNIVIGGGVLTCSVSGSASKGISTDGNLTVTGGFMRLTTSGSALYDATESDLSSAACIKCDGDMNFADATLYATSSGAAGKGINVEGLLTIHSGKITVTTSGRQYVYGSLDSSPKGIKATGDLTINGGYIAVTASGGEGSEGIESKGTLTVNGGTIVANCYDDCLNAATNISINGGNLYCYSSNNDGIDSNGTLTVTGGLVISSGTTAPEEGFDCDQNTFTITGGTLIGVGGSNSTPTSSRCTQRSILYSGSGTSGNYVVVADATGNAILTYKLPRTYSQLSLLFSSPLLLSSTAYTLWNGASVSGGTEWNGYYLGGTFANGSQSTGFTPSNMVTTLGSSQGGGMGNNPWR